MLFPLCVWCSGSTEGCLQDLGVWDPDLCTQNLSGLLSLCQAGQQLAPKRRNYHFLLSHPQRISVFSSFELNLPIFFYTSIFPPAWRSSGRAVGRGISSMGMWDAVLAGYRDRLRPFLSSTWTRQAVFQSFCFMPVTTLWSIPISIDLLA